MLVYVQKYKKFLKIAKYWGPNIVSPHIIYSYKLRIDFKSWWKSPLPIDL